MIDLSKDQMSPTGSLLNPKGVPTGGAITLPSQVPDDLEKEKPEIPQGIQSAEAAPVEPQVEQTVVPEPITNVTQEMPSMEPTGVPEGIPVETGVTPQQELTEAFTFEEDEEPVDDWGGVTVAPAVIQETPIPNADKLGIENNPKLETDDADWGGVFVAPSQVLTEDQLKVEKHVDGVMDTMNKIAYRGVKGIADALDFVTVPGWAIGTTFFNGQEKPFASLLESWYPEKSYVIADDADAYYDDVLRVSGTGLEFVTGGLVTAGGASAGQKLAGLAEDVANVAIKSEVMAGITSGVGYQSVLEYSDNELAAFVTAILAPTASKPTELLFKGALKATKETAKLAAKPITLPLGKIYNWSPAIQMANPKAQLYTLKAQLAGNEEMWAGSLGGRLARKLVERLPDNAEVTLENQVKQIEDLQQWLASSLPRTDRMREHVVRMTKMESDINAWATKKGLGEFKLTLDQMYKPLLKDMKDTKGLDELIEVGKLIGADAYAEQVRLNNDVLYKFLADKATPVSVKQSKAFQQVFKDQADELDSMAQEIVDKAVAAEIFNKSSGAYAYPSEGMPQVIEGLNTVKKLHQDAYGAWKETLPEMDLDVTPITNAFEDMAASTGLFDDPKNTPAYLRKMVADLTSLGNKPDVRVKQLDATDDLDIQLKQLAKDRRELQLKHTKELEGAENKTALASKHKEEMNVLDDLRTELNTKKLELSKEKRAETHKEMTGEIDIPRPSFTSLQDVLKAHKILSDLKFDSLKQGDDRFQTIKPILDSVDETLEGLKEIDEDIYQTWRGMQDNFKRFVGYEMRDTFLKKAVGPDGRNYKLSSGRAVDLMFTNAKADEIQDLLRVFDTQKEGLDGWLKVLPESTEEVDGLTKVIAKAGPEAFGDISKEATDAYKDIVYTALANEVFNKVEGSINLDPSKRLESIDKAVLSWMQKHKDKLEIIPDMELTPENIGNLRTTLGKYIDMVKVVEDQRKLAIFNELQGPGLTIQNAVRDDVKAQQLADFLEDTLPQLPYKDKGQVGVHSANNLRDLMYRSLIRDNMDGDTFNYKAMGRMLTEGSSSRNNLLKVLGEHSVSKLDAKVALHKAIQESDLTLTEALNSDKVIRGLGKIGISFGRIGSLLQRRAVFQPSGGYLAGAAMSKLINVSGKLQTSKAIQVFMDNPAALVEFDNILLRTKEQLSPAKQSRMATMLQEGNIKGLYPLLKDLYVGEAKGYFGYLGLQIPDAEIEQAIKEVFLGEPEGAEDTEEKTNDVLKVTEEITEAQITDKLRSMSAEERLKLFEQLGDFKKSDAEIKMESMSPEERAKLTEINGREEDQ